MNIRKLEGYERFDASLISLYCFHGRAEDPEAKKEEVAQGTGLDWGAFTDEGVLAARIFNNRFEFLVDGTPVMAGGIGAVSTLPEYREMGAVRAIFKSLLPEARKDGEVISALYPFNQAFYRKQGYEVISYQNSYELAPQVLSSYKFGGTVRRWTPGEPADRFLKIYETFANGYNLACVRDQKRMENHLNVNALYMDRKFSYLFTENGEDIAYLIMKDIKSDPKAILHVEECAWTSRAGFYAILAFLGRFTADYGKIQLPLPSGIDLLKLLRSPQAYEVSRTSRYDYMVRVMNAKKLLETIKKPAECDFTIRVEDELLSENNCLLQVKSDAVTEAPEAAAPDITVNVRALAQMAVGAISFDEALLRPDVEVTGKEELLSRVFTRKKIMILEHF